MSISVVISTYNHPRWLEKVLHGYTLQTFSDFELVVADDGSGEETRDVIERFRADHPKIPLNHVWHEDQGYRRQTILNLALQELSHDYLLMTDGDCVPRPDFLAVHMEQAEPGYFLSGGYCKLPIELSRQIDLDDIASGRAFDVAWLKENGLEGASQQFRLGLTSPWNTLADLLTPTKATWNNCNASGWTKDIIAVNGFNETMQYGGSDRELGERLWNSGLKSKQIRNRAICLHLDHKRGYKNAEQVAKNKALRQNVIDKKIVWCPDGIIKSPVPPSS